MLVRSMWWPHYVDQLVNKNNQTFWTHSDVMFKSVHKYYILMVLLPTLLHGFVPAVHTAILMIVYALRRLNGQVVSQAEAVHLGVEPGSPVIKKTSIPHLREALIRGLVLLEGCLPVATINPNTHHLVHYAPQTQRVGILGWFAMWAFERHNKKIKSLVRNARHTLTSLAKSLRLDIATRFTCLAQELKKSNVRCMCKLSQRMSNYGHYILSEREKSDFGILGVNSSNGARAFYIAQILGVHFRAGEWGRRRCGSVITTIFAGRSRYCYVTAFLLVNGKSFARVQWLSMPFYPCAPNRLIVHVRMLSNEEQRRYRSVIPTSRIDPCSVAVIPHRDKIHFSMLRRKGYDRVAVPYFETP